MSRTQRIFDVRSLPVLVALALAVPVLAAPRAAQPPQSAAGEPQLVQKSSLTLEGARALVRAGVAEARRLGAGGCFAVVDEGGYLLCLERVDGTFPAAAEVSLGKARTAVRFQKPTRVFEELVNGGRTTMVTLPDFTPLQGGVPIVVEGRVVGAIGVSGAASAKQDDELATAVAASFGSRE